MNSALSPLLALATTGALAAGLTLASTPTYADTGHAGATRTSSVQRTTPGTHVSAAELAQVRARQRALLARPAPAPTLNGAAARASAAVQRLTVNTTADTDLADPTGTRCLDATGACSLRAAVEAANNRQTPVRIILGKHAYTLSSGTELLVTNPAGTSIVGTGATHTTISGTPSSRVIDEDQAPSGGSGPLLYLSDVSVTGGNADEGGGILVSEGATASGSLVLDGVTVSGNTADTDGGGISAREGATLYATDTQITDNVAPVGAGLYTFWADANLTRVSIDDNHTTDSASGAGGGWQNNYGVLRMRGGSISGNTAARFPSPGQAGGGGLNDQFGNLSLTGVHINHNASSGTGPASGLENGLGGGILAFADLLEITGGSISHNSATGGPQASGGGIAAYLGAQIGLHGVTMADDRTDPTADAGYGGGAIFLAGNTGLPTQLTVDGESQITGANNGAVYASPAGGQADLELDSSQLSHNTDTSANGPSGTGCGGALCLFGGFGGSIALSMTADKLVANTSSGNLGAGAITASGSTDASSTARVHLVRSVFLDNTTGADGLGGAVGISSPEAGSRISVRSDNNTFTGNQAGTPSTTSKGGALAIGPEAAFSDHGSTYTGNRARGTEAWGGAVYTNTEQTSAFAGSTFTHNAASPTGIGHGGAVFTDDPGGTSFDQVSVLHNRSGEFGGGLDSSADGYSVSVVGSTLAGNVAGSPNVSGAGGGIYVFDGVLTFENSTVTENKAVQSSNPVDGAIGGGIYIEGSSLGLRYSTVTGNVAPRGGGVYADGLSGALLGSIVTLNHNASGGEQDCSVENEGSRPHSLGGNLLGQKGCVTAMSSSDQGTRHPRLAALAKNGGPTKTMALTKKSPAIGIATFQCPPADQRGHDRPATRCDAGAFELPKVKK